MEQLDLPSAILALLLDRPLDNRFDVDLGRAWTLRHDRTSHFVINPTSTAAEGPLVHHDDCETFREPVPEDWPTMTPRQAVTLFWSDDRHRHATGRILVGWCQRCCVKRVA